MALAEQLDIRLLMCTESFNLLRSKAPYDKWSTSYLNKANGGILDRPQGTRVFLETVKFLVSPLSRFFYGRSCQS